MGVPCEQREGFVLREDSRRLFAKARACASVVCDIFFWSS